MKMMAETHFLLYINAMDVVFEESILYLDFDTLGTHVHVIFSRHIRLAYDIMTKGYWKLPFQKTGSCLLSTLLVLYHLSNTQRMDAYQTSCRDTSTLPRQGNTPHSTHKILSLSLPRNVNITFSP
jgi:hypothetical protein